MRNRNTGSSQGDGGSIPIPPPVPPVPTSDELRPYGDNAATPGAPPGQDDQLWPGDKQHPPPEHLQSHAGNTELDGRPGKKGGLFLHALHSSFLENAIPQKGSEVNLILGGIDLKNSGSVAVKADKKLLTVHFPDGRTFTLKAETLEDLYEWKTALENALGQAAPAALAMGQDGILKNDQAHAEEVKQNQPAQHLVVRRPVLLALEDIDGSPSFLEKALRFVEEYGVKVEGILRQAADVDDVERRIREYEQGKDEFSAEEDAHVIADCIKYVLREMPSSPVPASCCSALLQACRTDRSLRLSAMRNAICETFPEPNRQLLQRILMMMQTVAAHKAVNRMSLSAVAACMAPLLLRPLLAGDCELENDFDLGGDGSAQLMQAAAAANHAQAIVITLLEDYGKLFGTAQGDSIPFELFSDSESGSGSEEVTDDDETIEGGGDDDDATNDDGSYTEDDLDDEVSEYSISHSESTRSDECEDSQKSTPSPPQNLRSEHDNLQQRNNSLARTYGSPMKDDNNQQGDFPAERESLTSHGLSKFKKSSTVQSRPIPSITRAAVWGRAPGRKNLSMESVDFVLDDEVEIQKLEATRDDLQIRIEKEVRGNTILQASLEDRKQDLQQRRLALQQEVASLQKQLQKERVLRATLEAGLKSARDAIPLPAIIDEKTKADIEELAEAEEEVIKLKQQVDDLCMQLDQQPGPSNNSSVNDSCSQFQETSSQQVNVKGPRKDVEVTSTSYMPQRSRRSKAVNQNVPDFENDKKQEHTSVSNKQSPLNQQHLDRACSSNSISTGSSAIEPTFGTSMPPNYLKKSRSREIHTNTTTSALSKLTTRLNFLKERRTQIANELQNMDKGQRSGHSTRSTERERNVEAFQFNHPSGRLTDGYAAQNSTKNSCFEGGEPYQRLDKRIGTDLPASETWENSNKLDSQAVGRSRKVKKLDSGKIEGSASQNKDKAPGAAGGADLPSTQKGFFSFRNEFNFEVAELYITLEIGLSLLL
ncbi:Ternary complex factor MIP1, leucine-zipper, partial [Dillenia turbinata]